MCDDPQDLHAEREGEDPARDATTGAWFMLTQYGSHSSYGTGTAANRARALASFHEHYNVRFHDPLYIVSDALPPPDARPPYPYVRLHRLAPWTVPAHVAGNLSSWAYPNKFSVGYRHMIRFFAIEIWALARALGLRWVARLDDDSRILSRVPFHVFTFMRRHGVAYAYRNVALETPWWGERWHTFLRQFESTNATWILDQCPRATRATFTLQNCGNFFGFYNNFFVADARRFLRPDIQRFLRAVDDSGYMYTRRWNDLSIQSAAVQLYVPRGQVHRFVSFSYYHNQNPHVLGYGIAQSGVRDPRPISALVPWRDPVRVVHGMQTISFYKDGFGVC
tara:strand:- start:507 stop:1514 length:1008 start_codon:yes stop_codon:yes gene_type:complete